MKEHKLSRENSALGSSSGTSHTGRVKTATPQKNTKTTNNNTSNNNGNANNVASPPPSNIPNAVKPREREGITSARNWIVEVYLRM